MGVSKSGQGARQRTPGAAAVALVVLAASVAIALGGCDRLAGTQQKASDLARFASGAMKNLTPSVDLPPEPTLPFNDAQGRRIDLSKFKGKVVVVNLWATWCGPCVTEMPTLAKLQERYQTRDLVVVPISVNRADALADAKSFIDVHQPLSLYTDTSFSFPAKLKVLGLPTTIIYDRRGRELARVKGEAKWDSPEALALIDHVLKQ